MIPVFGKGSRIIVACSECGIEGNISKKLRRSTSGFLFVVGQNFDQIRTWKRFDSDLCYDCWVKTWEVVEDEQTTLK